MLATPLNQWFYNNSNDTNKQVLYHISTIGSESLKHLDYEIQMFTPNNTML